MKFIDLFCGIGGFHQALTNIGCECVFASDIDKDAQEIYEENFGLKPFGDITKIKNEDIPKFDILCAGFPCQPFSHSGSQRGFEDQNRGNLFFEILRILRHHKPKYLILENVRNLIGHDEGKTLKVIVSSLQELGYGIDYKVISPRDIGIPQNRPRVFITGKFNGSVKIEVKKIKKLKPFTSFLEKNVVDKKYSISPIQQEIISIFENFLSVVNKDEIKFPLWGDFLEFNGDMKPFPAWKQKIINKNKDFYSKNTVECISLLKKINSFIPSFRKLEWQAGNSEIKNCLLQFRPSGLRFKKNNYIPALVAMVQIPVICAENRILTPRECARLQSFPDGIKLHKTDKVAYKQLGNSVNVKVVEAIAKTLFEQSDLI